MERQIEKEHIDFDFDLRWDCDRFGNGMPLEAVEAELQELRKQGATHVYIYDDNHGVVMLQAYKEAHEEDWDYICRLLNEDFKHEEGTEERKLEQLERLRIVEQIEDEQQEETT